MQPSCRHERMRQILHFLFDLQNQGQIEVRIENTGQCFLHVDINDFQVFNK